MNDANFVLFFLILYMKRHLLNLDYLFCVFLACSESQHVFKYLEYLKSYFKVLFQQD